MITLQEEHKMTVREACKLIKIYAEEGSRINSINISADGNIKKFCPDIGIEMAAYGDFVISEIGISEDGVELTIKREFVRATPTA